MQHIDLGWDQLTQEIKWPAVINKPLQVAGMLVDDVSGWEIVRKININILAKNWSFKGKSEIWGQSLSQAHNQLKYQQPRAFNIIS